MKETWVEIDEFPGHCVSDQTTIVNGYTGMPLKQTPVQTGMLTVGLPWEGKQHRRSVALIVAKAFLPDPPRHDFTTPIHLDGDYSNCLPENLMWRPRWFAIKYHQERVQEPFPNWRGSFEIIQTGEIFDHPRDCAVTHGLLETSNCGICIAVVNESNVWPTGFDLRFI